MVNDYHMTLKVYNSLLKKKKKKLNYCHRLNVGERILKGDNKFLYSLCGSD